MGTEQSPTIKVQSIVEKNKLLQWLYTLGDKILSLSELLNKLSTVTNLNQYAETVLDFYGIEIVNQLKTGPEWMEESNNAGVIIYGPHTSILGPLAVMQEAKLPTFISIPTVKVVIPDSLHSYFISVTPSNLGKREDGSKTKPPKSLLRNLRLVFYPEEIASKTVEEIRNENTSALNKAKSELEKGGRVTIFPTSGQDITHNWYLGLGRLVKDQLESNKPFWLQPFIIEPNLNTFKFTSLYLAKKIAKKVKSILNPQSSKDHICQVSFRWLEPMKVEPGSDLWEDLKKSSPKEIVSYLQDNFSEQVSQSTQ